MKTSTQVFLFSWVLVLCPLILVRRAAIVTVRQPCLPSIHHAMPSPLKKYMRIHNAYFHLYNHVVRKSNNQSVKGMSPSRMRPYELLLVLSQIYLCKNVKDQINKLKLNKLNENKEGDMKSTKSQVFFKTRFN